MKIELTDEERSELLKIISIVGFQCPDKVDWEIIDGLLRKLDARSVRL